MYRLGLVFLILGFAALSQYADQRRDNQLEALADQLADLPPPLLRDEGGITERDAIPFPNGTLRYEGGARNFTVGDDETLVLVPTTQNQVTQTVPRSTTPEPIVDWGASIGKESDTGTSNSVEENSSGVTASNQDALRIFETRLTMVEDSINKTSQEYTMTLAYLRERASKSFTDHLADIFTIFGSLVALILGIVELWPRLPLQKKRPRGSAS